MTQPNPSAPPARPSVFAGQDVFDLLQLETGPAGTQRPVYEDDDWDLRGLANTPRSFPEARKVWLFSEITNPVWRQVAKDVTIALRSPEHEKVIVLPGAYRIPRHPLSCALYIRQWRIWFNWLSDQGVQSLAEVTQQYCARYLEDRSWSAPRPGTPRRRLTPASLVEVVKAVQVLSPYGPLTADRYPEGFVPWDGKDASTIAGKKYSGENSTPPVPAELFRPLLANCLYLVNVLGPHVGDLMEQARATAAQWRRLPKPGRLKPAHVARIQSVVTGYRRQGRPLPRLYERHIQERREKGWSADDPLFDLNTTLLVREAGILQLDPDDLPLLRPFLEPAVAQVDIQGWWGHDAALVPRADAGELVPWTEPLTTEEIYHLVKYVRGACLVVTAAVSGMRPSELMEITGSSRQPPQDVPGGGSRFRLASKLIKGQEFGGVPDEWVVVEEVDRAVALATRQANAGPQDRLFGTARIAKYVAYLRTWCEKPTARRLGLASIPDGPVTGRMLRRTLSLELAKRPGGLLAAKIHLKHVSVATTEGYANRPGGSQAVFRAEVEQAEHEHHLALTVAAYRDYKAGSVPTGPGARDLIDTFRQVDAVGDVPSTEPMMLANDRRLENLLRQQAATLHVGTANYCWFKDPAKALCLRLAGTTDAKRPLVGLCDSARCPQATHHREHRTVWADKAKTVEVFLGNPRVPKSEKQRLRAEHDRSMRVVAEIDAANGANYR